MRLSSTSKLASVLLLTACALAVPVPDDASDPLAVLDELAANASANALADLSQKRSSTCTASNIVVRREWYVQKYPLALTAL